MGHTGVVSTPQLYGRALARFQLDATTPDDGIRLTAYAESPRVGDWSLRGALVRFAQPQPTRASAVLELVRRTDAALKPYARLLERTTTATDPRSSPAAFAAAGHVIEPSTAVRTDARTADLARVAAFAPDMFDGVLSAYEEVTILTDDEREMLPLLAVAAQLDDLGDRLANWAADRGRPCPDGEVDRISRRVFTSLAGLGVEREQRPPNRA